MQLDLTRDEAISLQRIALRFMLTDDDHQRGAKVAERINALLTIPEVPKRGRPRGSHKNSPVPIPNKESLYIPGGAA